MGIVMKPNQHPLKSELLCLHRILVLLLSSSLKKRNAVSLYIEKPMLFELSLLYNYSAFLSREADYERRT